MAWRSVDKWEEPLMRLERPATSYSQETAHFLLACFNDVLSEQSADYSLAISQEPGSSAEFRKYYVDKLKGISDKYNEELEDLSKLEHHLLEAKTKALMEDSRCIEQTTTNYPAHNDTQFPLKKARIWHYLDEQLLKNNDLLVPSSFFVKLQSPRPLSKSMQILPNVVFKSGPSNFHYLESTETSRQHAQDKSEKGIHLPPIDTDQKRQLCKNVNDQWKSYMSVPDRLEEKVTLANMTKKIKFSRNPKFLETSVTNTSSTGTLQIKRRTEDWAELNSLVVDPVEVVFTNYQTGQLYKKTIVITNVGTVSRLLRLTKFESSYFSVSSGDFPGDDSMVAPGMHCTFTITFKPDSVADFSDFIQFVGSNGQYLKVTLKGIRPDPVLSIPSDLDCGGCLLKNMKTNIFKCMNSGGDGNFQFLLPLLNAEEGDQDESEYLIVGAFQIYPRKFSIPAGDSVDLKVVFSPHEAGLFIEEIVLACDNGSTVTYRINGQCEMINIGCTLIRPSTPAEKLSFNSSLAPGEATMIQATMLPAQSDYNPANVISTPVVDFPPVCPLNSSFQTIIIHNFSNVSLPFLWKYYHPTTKPMTNHMEKSNDSLLLASNIETSESCRFQISPSSGVLPPSKSTAFVARFNPDHLGNYVDMGYLTLTGGFNIDALDSSLEYTRWLKLSETCVAVVCVQLHGVAQPFNIEMVPPMWIIPGKIPFATNIKRNLKVINHSFSEVQLQWAEQSNDTVSINITPNSGLLGIGESGTYEVSATANSEGVFHVKVFCSIKGSSTDILFQVVGNIEGPIVELAPGRLLFDLISVGHSARQTISLTNNSRQKVDFSLQQLVQDKDSDFVDYKCLSFVPAEGKILPQKSTSVVVECHGLSAGRLWTTLQLLINNSPYKFMHVEANIQTPSLCLKDCQLQIEDAYVGIPAQYQIVLHNNTIMPTQFIWKTQVFGKDAHYCRVDVKVMTGKLGPRESTDILLDITWTAEGQFDDALLMCEVVGSTIPVVLALSANVKGLTVQYQLLQNNSQEEVYSAFPLSSETGRPLLDYGNSVELRKPTTMTFSVTNLSAISTTINVSIANFKCSNRMSSCGQSVSKKHGLLKKTRNSISSDMSLAEKALNYLSDGHGACFVVEPSNAELQAFQTLHLTVTAYADMWGQYTDQLHCKVHGLEDYVIDVKAKMVGCPIYFQATGHYGHTTLRFGSHLARSETVKRIIKIRNDAPVDLLIDWSTFNVTLEDNQLIDLITYFRNSLQSISNLSSSISDKESIDSCSISAISQTSNNKNEDIVLQTKEVYNIQTQVEDSIEEKESIQDISSDAMKEHEIHGKDYVRSQGSYGLTQEDSQFQSPDFKINSNEENAEYVKQEVPVKDEETGEEKINFALHDQNELEIGEPLVRKKAEYSFPAAKFSEHEQIQETESSSDSLEKEPIHVLFKMHEGKPAKSPFTISPKQLVIPGRGQTTITATFTPADDVSDKLGSTPCGYALGYMRIIDETNTSCTERLQGYAVDPLRINMMAGIDQSELHISCLEDNGLCFIVPASLLLNENFELSETASDVQYFTMTNTSTSVMKYKMSTSSSHFHVSLSKLKESPSRQNSSQPFFTIIPQETVQFVMKFSFKLGNIRDHTAVSVITYSDELLIQYSTGHTQMVPLSANVHLPVLSLSQNKDSLGTCVLDSNNTTSFVISNSSLSSAVWKIDAENGEKGVQVFPQSGRLMPFKNPEKLNFQYIQVLFTPRSENEFYNQLTLVEELTLRTYSFDISGVGSADEQYVS